MGQETKHSIYTIHIYQLMYEIGNGAHETAIPAHEIQKPAIMRG